MKVDLAELKSHITGEIEKLEQRKRVLEAQVKHVEAVQLIAEKVESEDPSGKALEELVNSSETAKKGSEESGEDFSWAFSNPQENTN